MSGTNGRLFKEKHKHLFSRSHRRRSTAPFTHSALRLNTHQQTHGQRATRALRVKRASRHVPEYAVSASRCSDAKL
jgi:hypothetical protein